MRGSWACARSFLPVYWFAMGFWIFTAGDRADAERVSTPRKPPFPGSGDAAAGADHLHQGRQRAASRTPARAEWRLQNERLNRESNDPTQSSSSRIC